MLIIHPKSCLNSITMQLNQDIHIFPTLYHFMQISSEQILRKLQKYYILLNAQDVSSMELMMLEKLIYLYESHLDINGDQELVDIHRRLEEASKNNVRKLREQKKGKGKWKEPEKQHKGDKRKESRAKQQQKVTTVQVNIMPSSLKPSKLISPNFSLEQSNIFNDSVMQQALPSSFFSSPLFCGRIFDGRMLVTLSIQDLQTNQKSTPLFQILPSCPFSSITAQTHKSLGFNDPTLERKNIDPQNYLVLIEESFKYGFHIWEQSQLGNENGNGNGNGNVIGRDFLEEFEVVLVADYRNGQMKVEIRINKDQK